LGVLTSHLLLYARKRWLEAARSFEGNFLKCAKANSFNWTPGLTFSADGEAAATDCATKARAGDARFLAILKFRFSDCPVRLPTRM